MLVVAFDGAKAHTATHAAVGCLVAAHGAEVARGLGRWFPVDNGCGWWKGLSSWQSTRKYVRCNREVVWLLIVGFEALFVVRVRTLLLRVGLAFS